MQFVGVEPDAHGILAGAEDVDIADARHAREFILQMDRRVIGEIERIVARVGRIERDEEEDRGRFLLDRDALRLDGLRQRGERRSDAILHQDLREIDVGADLEGHGQRIAAVGSAGRLHVNHAFDAVDLLFDRLCHRLDQGLGAGAGVIGRHLNRRRGDVGIFGDRQAEQSDAADHEGQDGDDIGEDRPVDEEFRNHRAAYLASLPGSVCNCGSTFSPGAARNNPTTMTLSFGVSPDSIRRKPPKVSPIVTLRCSTILSALTTST